MSFILNKLDEPSTVIKVSLFPMTDPDCVAIELDGEESLLLDGTALKFWAPGEGYTEIGKFVRVIDNENIKWKFVPHKSTKKAK